MMAAITPIPAATSTPRPVRVGWVTFSPTHYHSPLYRAVAADPRIDLTVIYLSRQGLDPHEGGYGQPVAWDVDLLSGYRSRFARRADRNGVPLDRRLLHYRDLDVAHAVRKGEFEVLILHGYNSGTHQLAALAQFSLGRPVIFREAQNLLTPRPLWKTAIKRLWLGRIFGHSAALCVGSENARWFAYFGLPETRRYLAPNAVDNDRLAREATLARPHRAAIRRSLDLPPERDYPVVLAVGRLAPQKDPLLLLRAFSKVRSSTPCALLFVGSGPLGPAIEAEVRRLRVPDVHLVGFLKQSEIVRAYIAADLLVLPSALTEAWGLVVNEAMVCGLPVIVSNRVGAGGDLVDDGVNGHVVEAGDENALAEAIASIVSSPERRHAYGEASTRMIKDWTHHRGALAVAEAVRDAVGPERWAAAQTTHGVSHD